MPAFAGDDDPSLVAAALACRACLSGEVDWSLLIDDFDAEAICRCRACGYTRAVSLTSEQALRLALAGQLAEYNTPMAVPARTDALDVIVELLAELDKQPAGMGGPEFYDRLCTALCSVANMQRAGLLLYDEVRQLVVPVGSHGLDAPLLRDIYGTLEETPIAQVALSEDRVVRGQRRPGALGARALRPLPRHRHAHLHAGLGRRALARRDLRRPRRQPLRADRGRAPRDVDARQDRGAGRQRPHRDQPAGPRAAAAGAHRPRARDPRARRAAAVRRVAGARLRARPQRGGAPALRRRDAGGAQGPARRARPPARAAEPRHRRHAARGARAPGPPLQGPAARARLGGGRGGAARTSSRSPSRCSPRRCATPTSTRGRPACSVRVGRADGAFMLEVRNDGARSDTRGTGMGLRLAAVEALGRGALVEFGPEGGEWRVRLVVPIEDDEDEPRAQPARAGRGRPRRGALGLSPAADRAALGRALPVRVERRGGAGAGAPLRPARGAGRPVPGRGVGRRAVRGDPARVADHARAADLRRRLDLAAGRQGRRRVGLRVEGLVGRRRGRGGAHGRARG